MNTPRATLVSLALALVLAGCLGGCASRSQVPQNITDSPRETEPSERVASQSSEPTVRIPAQDAAGSEISDLPRYPGAVRTAYERGRRGNLKVVHARYLTRDGLDAVRGYYRGVFRAKGWEVANADFYDDEWTFLAIHDEREVDIEIEAQQSGVTGMEIALTQPLPQEVAQQKAPQQPQPRPAPSRKSPPTPAPETPVPSPRSASSAPQSASPAPQSASPAPLPASPAPRFTSPPPQPAAPQPAPPASGYYGDDYGDDGGGDD